MDEKEKTKIPYTLIARCGNCGKHIRVLLNILVIEQAEFGVPETYTFQSKIPKYLKHAFQLLQDNFTSNLNYFKTTPLPSSGRSSSSTNSFDITIPLCKSCRIVEELKK